MPQNRYSGLYSQQNSHLIPTELEIPLMLLCCCTPVSRQLHKVTTRNTGGLFVSLAMFQVQSCMASGQYRGIHCCSQYLPIPTTYPALKKRLLAMAGTTSNSGARGISRMARTGSGLQPCYLLRLSDSSSIVVVSVASSWKTESLCNSAIDGTSGQKPT